MKLQSRTVNLGPLSPIGDERKRGLPLSLATGVDVAILGTWQCSCDSQPGSSSSLLPYSAGRRARSNVGSDAGMVQPDDEGTNSGASGSRVDGNKSRSNSSVIDSTGAGRQYGLSGANTGASGFRTPPYGALGKKGEASGSRREGPSVSPESSSVKSPPYRSSSLGPRRSRSFQPSSPLPNPSLATWR